MFQRILIANRGEIACRIIDTCRRMGVGTIAVYSDPDRGARHVAMADLAYGIGGALPVESYLRGDAIIAAARAGGAQAIHPGYGFLSENAEFADAVTAAGLVFIGPSGAAIRAMGLKDAAKRLMAAAGVPVVPGYLGADQTDSVLAAEASGIGYPVLIKAVAGGGGKGMRLVTGAEGCAEALASARGEALAAFGNDRVLIEKYIERPRHIEVQVFGDGVDAVHLHERDCSLQRRHQKVIEEAPAPGMTADMRAAMGAAAVRAARAVGYSGAGTVEFIVDASQGLRADRFWFMEMNTRLQVEHPVTEAVTGIDLVEWQVRVAAGQALPLRQEQIPLNGHAFEARLYAEDVAAGFLPATGRLAHLAFPGGARVETGVVTGDVISPWYDPMIAKLIVHGPTRAEALVRLQRALAGVQVAGTVTNLGFLGALARHAGFVAGAVDTGLIARDLAALCAEPVPGPAHKALAALSALGLDGTGTAASGFTLWQPLRRSVALDYRGERFGVVVSVLATGRYRVEVGADLLEVAVQAAVWQVDGVRVALGVLTLGSLVQVFDASGASGQGFAFQAVDPLDRAPVQTAAGNVITSPMPGLLRAVLVAAGDIVLPGQRLALVEAMKMEHALVAARGGVVAEVLLAAGAQVEAGAALILMVPPDAAA